MPDDHTTGNLHPNDIDLEKERRVPMGAPSLESVWLAVKEQGSKLDQLIGFIVRNPLDTKAAPALTDHITEIKALLAANTNQLANHEARLTGFENEDHKRITRIAEFETFKDDVKELKAYNESARKKAEDRSWAAIFDFAKMFAAGILGGFITWIIKGGSH